MATVAATQSKDWAAATAKRLRRAPAGRNLQLRWTPHMGYGLYAAGEQPLAQGTVLLAEPPLVLLPCETALHSACAACLSRLPRAPTLHHADHLDQPHTEPKAHTDSFAASSLASEAASEVSGQDGLVNVPACAKCADFRLCGREGCRVNFNQRHQPLECGITSLESYQQLDDQSIRETVRLALQILSHPKAIERICSSLSRMKRAKGDPVVTAIDQALDFIKIHCERRDLTSQLADLRDALIRCSTNAHGLFGVKWADIAICVCVEAAQLFNHSCYPNVILDYHSSLAAAGSSNGAQTTLVFRTLRPVSPGEQLLVSYAVCRQPRRARQAYLSRTLCFNCQCPRCTEDNVEDPLQALFCRSKGCSLTFAVGADHSEAQSLAGRRQCALCGTQQSRRGEDSEYSGGSEDDEESQDANSNDDESRGN